MCPHCEPVSANNMNNMSWTLSGTGFSSRKGIQLQHLETPSATDHNMYKYMDINYLQTLEQQEQVLLAQ